MNLSPRLTPVAAKFRPRRGAVAVEMAIITPFLVLLICCTVDVAQYINTAQLVSNASREGARKACRFTTETVAEVERTVLDYLDDAADIPSSAVQVRLVDAFGNSIGSGQLPSIESGRAVGVQVNLSYDAIRWTNWLALLNGSTNSSITFARRE